MIKRLSSISAALLLSASLSAQDINIKNDWQMIASDKDVSTLHLTNASCVKTVWQYDTTDIANPEWKVYTMDGIDTSSLPIGTLTSVGANEGFWVLGDGTCNISFDNTAPVFTSATSVSVNENISTSTTVITLAVTDEATVTYGIVDQQLTSFNVNSSTGVVTFKSSPDYESKTSHTFTATATDTNGNVAEQDVTVNINDLDDTAPVFTSATTVSIQEHSTMTAYTATSDDATAIYSLSGTDVNDFTIDSSSGVVTFKAVPDYEVKTSHSITVTATDTNNNASSLNVTITITNIDDTNPDMPSL